MLCLVPNHQVNGHIIVILTNTDGKGKVANIQKLKDIFETSKI